MSGDRELLELAAKAIGQRHDDTHEILVFGEGPDPNVQRRWNPLLNDGDALRLAVKLHIVIAPMQAAPYEERPAFTAAYTFFGPARADVLHGDDPDAATRRAIVRAAAEIGRSMP